MADQNEKLSQQVPQPGGMILRPDYVKGFVPTASRPPDRLFYLLDKQDDRVWEVDGYKQPTADGMRPAWMLILSCPVCRNNLTLDSTRKHLEITEEGIQSDVFRCSHGAQFGGVCPFSIALDRPRNKEERQVQVLGRWYKIDAVAKRA